MHYDSGCSRRSAGSVPYLGAILSHLVTCCPKQKVSDISLQTVYGPFDRHCANVCKFFYAMQVYNGHMRLSIEAFVHWGVSTAAATLVRHPHTTTQFCCADKEALLLDIAHVCIHLEHEQVVQQLMNTASLCCALLNAFVFFGGLQKLNIHQAFCKCLNGEDALQQRHPAGGHWHFKPFFRMAQHACSAWRARSCGSSCS